MGLFRNILLAAILPIVLFLVFLFICHSSNRNVYIWADENDSTLITFNQVCTDDSVSFEETITSIMENGIDNDAYNITNTLQNSNGSNLISYNDAQISNDGANLIKNFESCRLTAYKLKGESRYTIGYGHVIYPGDNTPMKITKSQAEKILKNDLKKYNICIQDMLSELDHRFRYTQSFIDGLGSLVYNCGPDGVKKTIFWKRMKQCRFDKSTNNINTDDLKFAIAAVRTANISSRYRKGHTYRRKVETRVMIKKLN